jgi:predicted Rdx family selenoprotein
LTSMFCTRFCMLLCSLWIVAEMCRTFAIEFARRVAVDSSRKASFQDYGIGV